ncbi:unnamed protein product [Phaeothamnion confervicola]
MEANCTGLECGDCLDEPGCSWCGGLDADGTGAAIGCLSSEQRTTCLPVTAWSVDRCLFACSSDAPVNLTGPIGAITFGSPGDVLVAAAPGLTCYWQLLWPAEAGGNVGRVEFTTLDLASGQMLEAILDDDGADPRTILSLTNADNNVGDAAGGVLKQATARGVPLLVKFSSPSASGSAAMTTTNVSGIVSSGSGSTSSSEGGGFSFVYTKVVPTQEGSLLSGPVVNAVIGALAVGILLAIWTVRAVSQRRRQRAFVAAVAAHSLARAGFGPHGGSTGGGSGGGPGSGSPGGGSGGGDDDHPGSWTALRKSELDALPVTKYGYGAILEPAAWLRRPGPQVAPASSVGGGGGGCGSGYEEQRPAVHYGGRLCGICLAEYEMGDPIRTLPCCHFYHQPCIDRWLRRSGLCPFCKGSAKTKSASSPPEGARSGLAAAAEAAAAAAGGGNAEAEATVAGAATAALAATAAATLMAVATREAAATGGAAGGAAAGLNGDAEAGSE